MKQKNKINRFLCALAILLGVAAAIAFWGFSFLMKSYNGESQWIYIPQNTDSKAVKDTLENHLGAVGANAYVIWSLLDDSPESVKGAYLVNNGENAYTIARRIERGQQTPIKVTINNVRTMQQLAERIASKMSWSSNEFLDSCEVVLPEAGFDKAEYPAAFLPDTYEFYWTASPKKVIERLLKYRNDFWNDERREKAKKLGLSPVKVATLASIVEEETNLSDERPVVARLYLNRLNKGMLLQADPTVKFAVGDFSLRRITGRHLAINSPYNTYKNIGLPPGPIRIVEKRSIDAVLNAPKHNYLYMCAKEDFSGRHNFAVDFETHRRNASRYQAELNRRNIR